LKRILILRFSAMGDVALLVPVVKSLTAAYPDVEVVIATRPKFGNFFVGMKNVHAFPADVDKTYTGFKGLYSLYKALLKVGPYDVVIDEHDHLRTWFLRFLFTLRGIKTIVFSKGRKEKKAFTRKENKITTPLPHTVDRYQEALTRAGFQFDIPKGVAFLDTPTVPTEWLNKNENPQPHWIGIAPFAMHQSKIWPLENYTKLFSLLIEKLPVKFFLFGGGKKEIEFFESLEQQFPNHCEVVAGKMRLPEELALMKKLTLMVCVDSSNMHLATLVNTPLLSIWGGTHPDVGFGPYGYDQHSIIQIDRTELSCRPCSVYGKATCYRGDFACMHLIKPEAVALRIIQTLV
jgi:ADP-heptose:LPS heptosyltransferase